MQTFSSKFDLYHEQATQATGLTDFGPDDYVEGLKTVLIDYDQITFSEVGSQMVDGLMTGLLVARLLAQKGFKEHPEFACAPIEKPIVIIGMPRTGSTALHRLLSKDTTLQWLPPWLGNTPMPRPPRDAWESNPWFQATKQGLEQFNQIVPALMPMHPMVADQADECRFGIEPSFWSPGFAFMGAVREYADFIATADATYAYKRFRQVLGLIAGGDRRRWVLKDPTTHLWAPEVVLKTFPDALFVYTHREPTTALTSLSDMMYAVRKQREPNLTSQQNGREQLRLWGDPVRRTEVVMSSLPADRVFDMHINELSADPVGIAEKIYRHFNIPVTAEAMAAWQHVTTTDARMGHGAHHFKTESCGFTVEEVNEAMGAYVDRYQCLYGKVV